MAARSAPRSKRTPARPRPSAAAATRRRAQAPPRYVEALGALESAGENVTLDIDGSLLKLTRLEKLLWPPDPASKAPGYTRRDYLDHLLRVGPYMLPHLRDRPLTLIRMPEGITGRRFVHFHYEQRLPAFVETVNIFSEKSDRAEPFLLCNNMATALWLAHVGTLELHGWHSRVTPEPDAREAGTDFASSLESLRSSVLNYPDYIVFDIDPYIYSGAEAKGGQPEPNRPAFEKGKAVAFWLKALLDSMRIETLVKTSGKTGVHVLVPIVRTVDYAAARAFAGAIARHLAREHPRDITVEWDVRQRTGKVFLDYQMNVRVKTLNVPYSVRGVPGAPVSMPLEWKTLETAQPEDFTLRNAAAIVEAKGDIWRDMLDRRQDLAKVLRAGAGLP